MGQTGVIKLLDLQKMQLSPEIDVNWMNETNLYDISLWKNTIGRQADNI